MSVGEILERDEDRPAFVRFESVAVHDAQASLKAGHYVSKDEDHVFVKPPYSKDEYENTAIAWFSNVERNVKNGRTPVKHLEFWKASYERFKEGKETPIDGTPVRDWNALSPAQCKNLISAGCRTIEDMAQANDEALRRIGMGAVELKKKAKVWLQAAKDHGPIVGQVTSLQKKNEQLEGTVESLQEQITLLSRQLDAREGGRINLPEVTPMEAIDAGITASDIIEKTPAEQYEEKFGKPPHHRMLEETILQKLKE